MGTITLDKPTGTRDTQDCGLLEKTQPEILTARLKERGSIISLWDGFKYSNVPCPTVLVYPAVYALDREKIIRLNPDFSGNMSIATHKKFRGRSVKELSDYFFREIKPQMSLMDFEYVTQGNQILVHLFAPGQYDILRDRINGLKGAAA